MKIELDGQNVVIVIVVADNEARVLAEKLPKAVIAGKVIEHVKETGRAGLAGVIAEVLEGSY